MDAQWLWRLTRTLFVLERKEIWIQRVTVAGWRCLCTRRLLRQKLRSGCALSPLFPFLCFLLSLFLLYVHTPHPPIPVFLSLTLSVKKSTYLHHSTSGWLGKNKKTSSFPQTLCLLIHGYEWLTHPCQMENFTWLFHQACGEFAWAFNQTSLQDVWE